jgi:hypothetical protein
MAHDLSRPMGESNQLSACVWVIMRDKQIISVLSIPAIMPKDTSIEAELEAA